MVALLWTPPTLMEVTWGVGGSALTGAILLVKSILDRRRARELARDVRWDERRETDYHSVADALRTIQEYAGPRAEEEERETNGNPRVRSDEELDRHQAEVDVARRVVLQASLGSLLLTPAATRILQAYEYNRHDYDHMGSNTPAGTEFWCVRECRAAFDDRAAYDLRQITGPTYAGRVGRRGLRRLWHSRRYRCSVVREALYIWWLTHGPQLTQADVRTPPRRPDWKTVEEMQRSGCSPVTIQQLLRLQRRLDPPPWTEPAPAAHRK